MSVVMQEEIKRWTARRKSALVLEINQGKTVIAEASRQFDLTPSEIERGVARQSRLGPQVLENALKARPEDVPEQYEPSSMFCRKCTAKPCWSCAGEKSGVPVGQGRELVLRPAVSHVSRSSISGTRV